MPLPMLTVQVAALLKHRAGEKFTARALAIVLKVKETSASTACARLVKLGKVRREKLREGDFRASWAYWWVEEGAAQLGLPLAAPGRPAPEGEFRLELWLVFAGQRQLITLEQVAQLQQQLDRHKHLFGPAT